VEEAARAVQRGMRPATGVKKAKKAKKAFGYSKSPKAAKKRGVARPAKSKGRAVVFQVQPNYWARVKRELHILICTKHAKYASLRRQLGKGKTQTAIVMSIGATIGATIGISAAVISPFVTLGLIALVRVGKNAWCVGQFE
jgi:hypothetical protein